MQFFYFFFLVISFSGGLTLDPAESSGNWRKPGCHKVGNTRKISTPDCVTFLVTTNACRGFCESWAVPSDPQNSQITQPVTSIGSCCNIMETQPKKVVVLCQEGLRVLFFKSAVSCDCYHCKKD